MTCESTLPTSALHAPFVNRRMPNGTYGGVRDGDRKVPTYSILPQRFGRQSHGGGRVATTRGNPLKCVMEKCGQGCDNPCVQRFMLTRTKDYDMFSFRYVLMV